MEDLGASCQNGCSTDTLCGGVRTAAARRWRHTKKRLKKSRLGGYVEVDDATMMPWMIGVASGHSAPAVMSASQGKIDHDEYFLDVGEHMVDGGNRGRIQGSSCLCYRVRPDMPLLGAAVAHSRAQTSL